MENSNSNYNDKKELNAFQWPVIIKNPNPHPNVDYYYGPYDNLDDLKSGVPNDLWVPGFTAATMDESGAMEEYWIVGEDSNAHWETKLTAVPDGTFRIMGFLEEGKDITDVENPSLGDVYFQRQSDGSDDDNFKEFIWLGDSWEMLGQAQLNITMSTLTVNLPDDTSKTYNGTSAVTIDLSDVATRKFVADACNIISNKLINYPDDLTDKDLLARDTSTNLVKAYHASSGWSDTGITAASDSTQITHSKTTQIVNGDDVWIRRNSQTASPNYSEYDKQPVFYRLNPVVLAVTVEDKYYTSGSPNHELWVYSQYNPYGIGFSITLEGEYYKVTHNMGKKGILGTGVRGSLPYYSAENSAPYYVVGTASLEDRNSCGIFGVIQYDYNDFTFWTSDDNSFNHFRSCRIVVFEFGMHWLS